MYLPFLLLCLSLGVVKKCAAGENWCYTGCEHTPTHWGDLPGSFCGEKRQSPIDIVTSQVQTDPNLLNFTFTNFFSQHVKSLTNNGHTVKCTLEGNTAEINGGGLNGTYSLDHFHFHWGDTEQLPGSEHSINGYRYPMEMHIVTVKKGLTLDQALASSDGVAVLGFFIDATDNGNMSRPWGELTSLLPNSTGHETTVNSSLSINDLIGNVDLTKFYRYMGSLTTPNCTEAVVWTVFYEPIKINRNLIKQFPTKTRLTNIYRPTQDLNQRKVVASPATPLAKSDSWCYEDHCDYTVSQWPLLPQSYCAGARQSPINIDTQKAVVNELLGPFTYTNFNNKNIIKSFVNTGHSVQGVLKEDIVEVSGGGLGYVYSTVQFHLHWGSSPRDSMGSEHTVNSKGYPMELHIVSKRKDLTMDKALLTPNGLAVLGFFIKANSTSSPVSGMEAWKTLTRYLSAIKNISSVVEVTEQISIDDLLGDVDQTTYYRYNGSLTTPLCNEAVVWTVFKEPIQLDEDLMMMFPNQTGYRNVFRPPQPLNGRTIYISKSTVPRPVMLFVLLASLCAFSCHFHL
ncbi:carbonic anhydrase 4-like [Mastacembelus armatus]|uniref:Carbonic anhydrase n=2 Tax=Mastacembelus armatus TaxID=205130 RepID=A0A7N9ALE8_9TELE|nr:carbonic anhydrase 4-like [Mastacembelus armatus]